MEPELRPWTADEHDAVRRAISRSFLGDAEEAHPLRMLDLGRTLSAWDDGHPVATAGAFSLQMALPGGVRPVAGVTLVSVQPTHRRRGYLTAMMRRQLRELEESGEAVAALWASETSIYGRFGYGLASRSLSVSLRRGDTLRPDVAVADVPVTEPAPADALDAMARIWDASYPARPGQYARDDAWWEEVLHDPPRDRDGMTALRVALAGDAGYALYRTKGAWAQRGPDGELRVVELAAVDDATRLRLWQHLLGIDLVGQWRCWAVAPDDALLAAVSDLRRLEATVLDNLHVRLVRVDEALAQRSFAAPVDVVLEVRDPVLPRNARRWRLSGDATGAACAPTSDPADLVLGVEELGAAHLGGTTLLELAAAGRVGELRAGALRAASRALRGDVAPVCTHVF